VRSPCDQSEKLKISHPLQDAVKVQHAQAVEAAENKTVRLHQNQISLRLLITRSFTLQALAQREVERLNLRVATLEQELVEAHKQAQVVQSASNQKADEALEPGEIKTEAVVLNTTPQEDGPDSQKALEELQAQFNQYKSEQSTKYEQGVMKVNSANVSTE
jgi:hypothetical protein